MWAEGRRILIHLGKKGNDTPHGVNLSFSLLERLVKEHSVTSANEESEWLYSRLFLNGLVKKWRNVAKKQANDVPDPVSLGKRLEHLAKQVPEFWYDTRTFSMILDVTIHQKSLQEAPIVAESVLNFLKQEADNDKPELRLDCAIWNQVLDAWAKSQLPEAPSASKPCWRE